MSLIKFVNSYIFKKRLIYFYALDRVESKNDYVFNFNLNNLDHEFFLKEKICSNQFLLLLDKRKFSPDWQIFIYLDNDTVQGYSFLHIPQESVWHDSLPTGKDEARTVSSFVEPAFRGRGIRGELLKSQKNFCIKNNKALWCVIESTNISSIRATQKSKIVMIRTNYLLKLIGRNVFSILTNPFKFFLLWGNKRVSR
ncbi:hypothetical protein [Acinetobacter sp. NIPH 2699]|uniref:hypothetical protein n=1 Tax=Acinetobacter sp. NIPH 2699 TaxID=2923433 RepID=UPI001F4BB7E6|nr:hypothetical protein [Acinetobacter sp. NIPH 2699]MCH7337301.1 hypothetical protein [Acinetobacter sp. NIPH 2699]